MIEEWRKIPGYPEHYLFSSMGRMKRCEYVYFCEEHARSHKGKSNRGVKTAGHYRRLPEVIMKGCLNSNGYRIVSVNHRTLFLHRLIALAFIPNPENLPYINHINAIRTDNRIENLEWTTPHGNSSHASKMGLYKCGVEVNTAKLIDSDVQLIRLLLIKRVSTKRVAKLFGVCETSVRGIRDRKFWKHVPDLATDDYLRAEGYLK